MKINLAISNIAWEQASDEFMYSELSRLNFSGIEIAPTRLFTSPPYEKIQESSNYAKRLLDEYGLSICSMQSIWFGITGQLFGTPCERNFLLDYSKKAILFAQALSCRNLVFGCPKNRSLPDNMTPDMAYEFFSELGDFAISCGTTLALEANPALYGTNFINTTREAIDFVKNVNNDGFKVNLDTGTIIHNAENISAIQDYFQYINHIHLSEPSLVPLVSRSIHKEIMSMAVKCGYEGYFSIEMGKSTIENVLSIMAYVNECRNQTLEALSHEAI